MAFNLQSWARLSANANSRISLLEDGSLVGAPSFFSYIHATDDINTITTNNYFGRQSFELNHTDYIYCAASDGIFNLVVLSVDESTRTVVVEIQSGGGGGGNVTGPVSSTNHAIARYSGTSGEHIADSQVLIDDANNVSGIKTLFVDEGVDINGGNTLNLWSNGNTYKTSLKGTANVQDIELKLPPNYPLQDGMQLTFDEDGTSYFATPTAAQWIVATGNVNMEAGNGYIANGAPFTLINLTLPTGPTIGDAVEVRGFGQGGFKIKQNAADEILLGAEFTTLGTSGYIQGDAAGDSVYLVCISTVPHNVWSCIWTGQISNGGGDVNTPGNLVLPIGVTFGGTGMTSAIAHGTICAGDSGEVLTSISPGTAGQILTSNGAGALPSYQNSSAAGENFQFVTSGPVSMLAGRTYVSNSASQIVFNLPATCSTGQIFGVEGMGTGGWKLNANTGQTIHFNTEDTTSGGYLESNYRYDGVLIVCIVANTEYKVFRSVGLDITVA